MGYGHQRTAYPLKSFAFEGKVINANSYTRIPERDKNVWESSRGFYEFISKFKRVPLIGNLAFSLFDQFQEILSFYPRRDLSKPNLSLKKIFSLIENGWGKNLVSRLSKKTLPLVTTFFIPAFMAENFDYPGEIFCVVCDADIARSWTSLKPQKSRIKYLAPNSWVVDRLKLYGVKEENIFLTGYPLPLENTGSKNLTTLKNDLAKRLLNLDPQGKYRQRYKPLIDKYLGSLPKSSDHPLTILFSIGGAGAQKEMAIKFVKSLNNSLPPSSWAGAEEVPIKIILSAGIREKVRDYFLEKIKELGLEDNGNVEIIFDKDINKYFEKFNYALRKTDILWTKPSELSFYTALGLPIIIAPSIGSQEDFNRRWLLRLGAGIPQETPKYANQWLFDYLESGRFAEAAMGGFLETEKLGTYNIKQICLG